jgi:hypothetical protein
VVGVEEVLQQIPKSVIDWPPSSSTVLPLQSASVFVILVIEEAIVTEGTVYELVVTVMVDP